MPFIRENYSVCDDRMHQAIGGFSLGGRQTLYVGLQRPDLFAYIGAVAPAPGVVPAKDWAMEHPGQMQEDEVTFEGKDTKLLKEHTKLWEPVIKNIFEVLIERNKTLVVMRWGNYAQKVGECFDNQPNIYPLDTTHPSPFSARNGFLTCNHFKKCNEILGEGAICWNTGL